MNIKECVKGVAVPRFENHCEENDQLAPFNSIVAETIYCQMARDVGNWCSDIADLVNLRATCKLARSLYSQNFKAIKEAGTTARWYPFCLTVHMFGEIVRKENWAMVEDRHGVSIYTSGYSAAVWIHGRMWIFTVFSCETAIRAQLSISHMPCPVIGDVFGVIRNLLPSNFIDSYKVHKIEHTSELEDYDTYVICATVQFYKNRI